MISPILRLAIKEKTIMSAFDELAIIQQTGFIEIDSIQNTLDVLKPYSYVCEPLQGEPENKADIGTLTVLELLSEIEKNKFVTTITLQMIYDLLGEALQLIQECINPTDTSV